MAPSLGALEDTPENIWGTKPYNPETDLDKPCVFFGLYGLPDFYALWRHRGKKWILWAGSDITHFNSGYWLDDVGIIRLERWGMGEWINNNCESWVENEIEKTALWSAGIWSYVCPSFLGDVKNYPLQKIAPQTRYYTSVSGDNFRLYGWEEIESLAVKNPDSEYHLYGAEWFTNTPNIIVHGKVTREEMNEQTRTMTGALRLTKFDGFSEILAKSYLWGQKPISPYIPYPYKNREDLLDILNKFPWNQK